MRTRITHPIFILSILYFGINISLFLTNDVKVVNDSHRYLEYAQNMRNGLYFDQHNFWYLGYALFIFAVQKIHDSVFAVVIAQYALSWIAVVCLYNATRLIFNDQKSALTAALFYILFFEIQAWNSYILCESVYCSLLCISFYLLASIYQGSNKTGMVALALPIFVLTFLTKPTGVALLGAAIATILVQGKVLPGNKLLRYLVIFGCGLGLILLINRMLTTYLVMENYQLGEIVYDITTLHPKPEYDLLTVSVPKGLYIPSESTPPLLKILSFIIHNPLYWTKLFLFKVFFFLVHIRPYWSIPHNIFSLLVLLPCYFYVVRGAFKEHYPREILVFFITFAAIHILSIGITSVDWDGRFLMPLLPALFIMVSTEVVRPFRELKFTNITARLFKS